MITGLFENVGSARLPLAGAGPKLSTPVRLAFAALLITLFAPLAWASEFPADPIANMRGGHPRLFLTDAEVAKARDAEATDPLRRALHARIIAAATADLAAPPIVHRLTGQEPRRLMLDQSQAAIRQIATCALAYRLTGDGRFARRAKSDLMTVAAFPDWNPSHFLDVAEMSLAVAIGYDWLYRELSQQERAAIKGALVSKALVFAPAVYGPAAPEDKRLFWVTARMNWNQVCNGGLLAAALAVADEEPDLARQVVSGVRRLLPLPLSAYEPDGAYPEGPDYWEYGTDYTVVILALLEDTLGTDFGLGTGSAFERTVIYRTAAVGPTGLAFNYADGDERLEYAPAYAWLARRFGDAAAIENCRALLDAEIRRRWTSRFLALDAAWFPSRPAGGAAAPSAIPLCLHFRGGSDIALFRSAWGDPRALFLGFKAGDNRTNHSHLDLGSFVLDADGVRWATDLGRDDYTMPGYFEVGGRRWSYFRLNNRSHNTVTPSDQLQDPKATAPIVAFSDSGRSPFAVADLTPAYPRAAGRILRGVAMLDRARILVQDEFTALRPGTPVRWLMMTGADVAPASDGRTALLTRDGRRLRAEVLEPAGVRFHVEPARPSTAAENPNLGYTELVIEVPPAPATADLRLAVVLTPVGERWPPPSPPRLAAIADWR